MRIFEQASRRVAKHSDVVNEDDAVKVKLLGFDNRGEVRLSMKQVDQATGDDLSSKKAADVPADEALQGELFGQEIFIERRRRQTAPLACSYVRGSSPSV